MVKVDRVLIYTGGNLGEWALKEIRKEDFIIGVDRGALFLVNHAIRPGLIVGDFDSISPEELKKIKQNCDNIAEYEQNKDYTDTEIAFDFALVKKPTQIILLGAIGTRFDHSFANVQLLYKGLQEKISCKIVDQFNEITIIDSPVTINKGNYVHVSLLPFSLKVEGVTLEGFQYPLKDKTLCAGESIGISNILEAAEGKISLTEGELLVIKSKD